MKLKFIGSRQVAYDRDGIDILYTYIIDDSNDLHYFHGVVGSWRSWNHTNEENILFRDIMFYRVIQFIKEHWDTFRELPNSTPDDEHYLERGFEININHSLSWQNYEFILE